MFFPWREDETNACKRGEKSSTDCKYNFCLWSGCLFAAVLVGLTSKGHALICHCGTRLGGLWNEEAKRHCICQEEILPDTAVASLVFFLLLFLFFSTSRALTLSTFPDIASTWKLCSLPLIVLVNVVILQNVTITSLCYLQGSFMLHLHLENALLADMYFSP